MNALISLLAFVAIIPMFATSNVAKLPNCAEKAVNQGLVLVNTLDGKLTVLDLYNNGKELWSMETGPGPMLSSNIHQLELTNNGHWVRMIPSLTGSLYQFNGDTIDAIPISAETLLTSSFRYSDDLVIAGGKEIRTYGMTLGTGTLLYECSLQGCVNKTDNKNDEHMVLVERNTQTVRAVEPRSGVERWNFSVGQLDVKFPQTSCHHNSNLEERKTVFDIKTVVPEGLVHVFGSSGQILWKKKFSSPIVNIWTWDKHSLETVDLFRNMHYTWSINNLVNNNNLSPAIYIGMHNKQLYVHESRNMQKVVLSGNNKRHKYPSEIKSISQIPWKPFHASSSELAVVNAEQITQGDSWLMESEDQNTNITAMSVLYASEYVNGNGYYLYNSDKSDTENSLLCDNSTLEENETFSKETNDENDTPVQVIIVSLWYWWKEVAVIAITTAFAVNIIINQRFLTRNRSSNSEVIILESTVPINVDMLKSIGNYTSHFQLNKSVSSESSNSNNSNDNGADKHFFSRYLTDFDPLHCLGKGGFGVVFEARNKIDECNYAVKRIKLPNKKHSRDRVMREVRALAKLDHRNIVRYFNAWQETPPQHWIAAFDREWAVDAISSEGVDVTSKSSMTTRKNGYDSSFVIDFTKSDFCKTHKLKDVKEELSDDSDSFIVFANEKETNTAHTNPSHTITSDQSEYNESVSLNRSMKHSASLGYDSNCNNTKDKSDRQQLQLTLSGLQSEKVFLYIQMQLCRKESLRDWLRENESRENTKIMDIFEQIVSAVEYVHQKGLIHRDLKPSNIFFSMEGEIKVGDFGLVTAMEECMSEMSDKTNSTDDVQFNARSLKLHKRHTDAVGTQLYMSPEQLKGHHYNFKVDIYSLGVILFELLVPFHTAMERYQTLSNLRKNLFPTTFCENYKHEHNLLSLMLSKNPDQRPTTSEIRSSPPLSRGQLTVIH